MLLVFTPASIADTLITPAQNLVDGELIYRDDADTFKVKLNSGIITNVRLACVDAPEVPHTKLSKNTTNPALLRHFQWGQRALSFVTELMPLKTKVSILPISTDYRYGRTVAEVILPDGSNLGQRLVSNGLAQVYDGYVNQCPDKDVLIAQQNAGIRDKVGLWSDGDYIAPAIARKLALGASTASAVLEPKPSPLFEKVAGLPPCVDADCNCKDFATQEEAQAVFDAFGDDRFNLDKNHNGVACDGLNKKA